MTFVAAISNDLMQFSKSCTLRRLLFHAAIVQQSTTQVQQVVVAKNYFGRSAIVLPSFIPKSMKFDVMAATFTKNSSRPREPT